MDIVIPLGNGSLNNNLELRYCLRSIQKHVPYAGNVFIIGERPDFLSNVIHIPVNDMAGLEYKERNIFVKILKACDDKRVSDDFLFFNDDHFLTAPWYPETFHYKCSLEESLRSRRAYDSYRKTLTNTLSFLKGGYNFDTHCPIAYDKERFRKSVGTANWYQKNGFAIKSLYCNMNGIEGSFYRDLKIGKPYTEADLRTMISDRLYFSVADDGMTPILKKLLEELYPNPSRYES